MVNMRPHKYILIAKEILNIVFGISFILFTRPIYNEAS